MSSKHQAVVKATKYPTIEVTCDGAVQKFTVEQQIGKGGFAVVKKGTRVGDGLRVAIKMRTGHRPDTSDSFDTEVEALREIKLGRKAWINSMSSTERAKYNRIHDLNRSASILEMDMTPRYICHGPVIYHGKETTALVTALARTHPFKYGKGMLAKDSRKWMGIVCILAHQIISRLEVSHQGGFVHRDVKLPNLVFGCDDRNRYSVQLIDFGCATRWRNKDGAHISEDTKPIQTNNFWMSPLQRHEGKEQTRKSDIEWLAMFLLHLATGIEPPWTKLFCKILKAGPADRHKISEEIRKIKADRNALCKGHDPVFLEHYKECDRLQFAEEPDYDRLREIWKNAYIRLGYNATRVPRAFFSHTEVAAIEHAHKHRKR